MRSNIKIAPSRFFMQFTLALGMLQLAFNQLAAKAELYPLDLECHLTEQSDSFSSFTTAEDPHKKIPLSPIEEPSSKEENEEEEENTDDSKDFELFAAHQQIIHFSTHTLSKVSLNVFLHAEAYKVPFYILFHCWKDYLL